MILAIIVKFYIYVVLIFANFCKNFSHKSSVYLCTSNFTIFYEKLDAFLEEYGKVADERLSSQVAHLPLAVSVNHLIKKINLEKWIKIILFLI